MNLLIKKFPSIFFITQCTLVGGLIMFVSMAAGELLVDPAMFNGFLHKPKIWPFIFIETATWILPFILLFLPIFNWLTNQSKAMANQVLIIGWIVIGLAVALGYKLIYYPGNWSMSQLFRKDITFGWLLPYMIILFAFVFLSQRYINERRIEKT